MIDFLSSFTWSEISNFHFIRPWWLLSLFPLLVFHYLLRKEDDLTSQWRKHMSAKMVERLAINGQQTGLITPRHLFLVIAIISTLVMAGPTWMRQTSPLFEDNSELIVVLDVADTMNQTDLQPTRLTRAKQKIMQLIEKRGDAKTALVVYGGSAHIAMPTTKDSTLAHYFLDVLDNQLLPDQTTKPGAFIDPVKTLLGKAKAPSTVLLLTDKTDEQAISRLQQEFAQLEHQVLVWAIGEHPGSGSGAEVIPGGLSQEGMAQLSKLAQSGHGVMVPFTHNSEDIDRVDGLIQNNLFGSQDADQPWLDSGYWLLFLLLPMQLMWFRRGWTLKW